jgi:hypothetical protein
MPGACFNEVMNVMKQLKDNLSDHQPTLTRFYFDKA